MQNVAVFLVVPRLLICFLFMLFFSHCIYSRKYSTICVKWLLSHPMHNFFSNLYQRRQSIFFFSLSVAAFFFCSIGVYDIISVTISVYPLVSLWSFNFVKQKCDHKIYEENRYNASYSSWDKIPSICCWHTSYQAADCRDFKTDPSTISSAWICEHWEIPCRAFNW